MWYVYSFVCPNSIILYILLYIVYVQSELYSSTHSLNFVFTILFDFKSIFIFLKNKNALELNQFILIQFALCATVYDKNVLIMVCYSLCKSNLEVL